MVIRSQVDINDMFTRESYTWIEMKNELSFLNVEDEQFEQFFSILDPFYSNTIHADSVKDLFASEMVEAKVKLFARPSQIISKLNSLLTKSSKMKLLRNLFEADVDGEGRISEKDF